MFQYISFPFEDKCYILKKTFPQSFPRTLEVAKLHRTLFVSHLMLRLQQAKYNGAKKTVQIKRGLMCFNWNAQKLYTNTLCEPWQSGAHRSPWTCSKIWGPHQMAICTGGKKYLWLFHLHPAARQKQVMRTEQSRKLNHQWNHQAIKFKENTIETAKDINPNFRSWIKSVLFHNKRRQIVLKFNTQSNN